MRSCMWMRAVAVSVQAVIMRYRRITAPATSLWRMSITADPQHLTVHGDGSHIQRDVRAQLQAVTSLCYLPNDSVLLYNGERIVGIAQRHGDGARISGGLFRGNRTVHGIIDCLALLTVDPYHSGTAVLSADGLHIRGNGNLYLNLIFFCHHIADQTILIHKA